MADNDKPFISEDAFHKRLTNVRTQDGLPRRGPDPEALRREQAKQQQRTLYQMPAMAAPKQEPVEDVERTIFFDSFVPSVFNFRHAMRQLQKETKRAARFSRPLTLFIVAFHELPFVRDRYGIIAQEKALRTIGDVLSKCADLDIDIVGRYGADRFIMALPETPGPNATLVAEEIRKYFEQTYINHNEHNFGVKASIGIACFPQHGTDWKELIAKADLATDIIIGRGGNAFGFSRDQ